MIVSATERIATAALLHDIGKFWSRTGMQPPSSRQERDHFDTYSHALWSAHFVEQYTGDAEMASWVRDHHKPETRESYLIALADWLSSGERILDEAQSRSTPERAALCSILSGIGRGDSNENWFLPLTEHGQFGSGFFPEIGGRNAAEAYQALWARLEELLNTINTRTAPHGTWLAIMRRFTARVPAATPTSKGAYVPDISLYEHSRIAAALAACLHVDNVTEEELSALRTIIGACVEDKRLGQPLCHLVCGNLSGIQDFLYSIPRKGATKTLKGRSFMLQLVAEACAARLCDQAGTPASCVVYNGGGRFYLLTPRHADIASFATELERHIHRSFAGALSLLVGWVDLTCDDFLSGGIRTKWGEAGQRANEKKARKYTQLVSDQYETIFGPVNDSARVITWESAGEEPGAEDTAYRDLGERLRRAKWLVQCKADSSPTDSLNQVFCPLDVEYYLVNDLQDLPEGKSVLELSQLDGYDLSSAAKLRLDQQGIALTYRLTARHWPQNAEQGTKTFEQLADDSQGICRLGVFRADVDNLGHIFAEGLANDATLSRVASLSSALSDFFEGYVDNLAERYTDTVGVVYAGGDDLFAVGAWNKVIDFAIELRRDFGKYCGHNPLFSFSGGVAIVQDHLPLRYAAELAHDAEETAKSYERGEKQKDALTLFGMPIGFEELDRFTSFQQQLQKLLTGGDGREPLPMGFLRRLYDIWETYRREQTLIRRRKRGAKLDEVKEQARWQRWRWMLTYGLSRVASKDSPWKEEISRIQDRLLDVTQPIEDRLGVPLRWTELLMRKEEER